MTDELLQYYKGDDFVAGVWKSKYAAKNEITPDDMHRRLAMEFAKTRAQKDKSKTLDEWFAHFFEMFKDFRSVMAQGRVLAGLGVDESYRSLSNCLRLPPPKDSYSSIMYVDTMLVSAAKRGCGYGIGLSHLRPSGALTTNAANTSTGVVTFGNRFSNSTHEVGQQGRRGACLEDLDVRHPNAPEWAVVKLDETMITGANISFKIWNDFMLAVKEDKDYILRFPVDFDINRIGAEFIELMKYNELVTWIADEKIYLKKVRAKELWDSSIHGVWSDGCPGLQFWERIVDYDPASVYKKYEIDGTNACGEQPKAVGDTCRLLTQNLFGIVDKPFTSEAKINFDRLYNTSYEQLTLGDDLVDLECIYVQRIIDKIISDPEPEEEKQIELSLWRMVLDMAKSGRRVGCGITGLADMIAAVGLKYDSEQALELVDAVMYTKMKAEYQATVDLAKQHGHFVGWDKYLQWEFDENDKPVKGKNDFYQFLLETYPEIVEQECIYGRRNINWSTIAPTGTVSIIAKAIKYPNISSGCEPTYFPYFFRNRKTHDGEPYDYIDEVGIKWKTYPVMMGAFKDWLEIVYTKDGLTFDPESLSKNELEEAFANSPWYGATAEEIDWKKRVEMQAILQKYTTSAISSTVNFPKDVKEQTISDLYFYAWEKGLKGITCYRDGSKGGVLVKEAKGDVIVYHDAAKRPRELKAEFSAVTVIGQKYGVARGFLGDKPYEVFAFQIDKEWDDFSARSKGKIIKEKKGAYHYIAHGEKRITIPDMGSLASHADEQMLTRLVSGMMRHGVNPKFIYEQISKCPLEIVSFGKALARVIKKYIPEKDLIEGQKCNDCGSTNVRLQEGCVTCVDCGSSKCG
jgi:ribonucleoside-diphosphate reductase alpha chain